MHDLTVVGAGPAGSFLASLCSKTCSVLLINDRKEAGNKACSGLVSGRVLEIVPKKIMNSSGVIEHTVNGARIHFGKTVLDFRKKGVAAYVINRDLFDRKLAEHAKSCGSILRFGTRAEGVSVTRKGATVRTGKGAIESRMVAGCDGAGSVVAGSISSKPPVLLNGLIAIENKEDRSDCVEMWFDKKIADGGFLWRIPRGDKTEFGALGRKINFKTLDDFFGLGKKSIVKRMAAPIPMGLVRTCSERVLLVGDSACQTKPWSGGGVTYGLLSAKVAADVIKSALKNNDFSEESLSAYQKGWEKMLLRDIKAGMVARELYNDLSNNEITAFAKRLEMSGERKNDIDFDFPFSGFLGDLIGS